MASPGSIGGEVRVLGIDAAWTEREPSGVALIERSEGRWRLKAVASSYASFIGGADHPSPDARPRGSLPSVALLLAAAEQIGGGQIDLVAVDMPLAHGTIRSRRVADDAVSRAYGARKCGTHSPNEERPGPISDHLRDGFQACGFPLKTQAIDAPGLIEVYPHPALVELARAAERLRYKQSKRRVYWPDGDRETRSRNLIEIWAGIIGILDREIDDVGARLPLPLPTDPTWRLKAFEDALDAVVCAWVGGCALQGLCVPYGDESAGIWIPGPGVTIWGSASPTGGKVRADRGQARDDHLRPFEPVFPSVTRPSA